MRRFTYFSLDIDSHFPQIAVAAESRPNAGIKSLQSWPLTYKEPLIKT
jgi:hypothetical protein